MVATVFTITENPSIETAGRIVFYVVALSFLAASGFFFLIGPGLPPIQPAIIALFLFFLMVNLIYALMGVNTIALTFLVQYIIILASFLLFVRVGYHADDRGFRIVAIGCLLVLAGYAAIGIARPSLSAGEGWAGGLGNQNLFGMGVLMLSSVAAVFLSLRLKGPPPRLAVLSFAAITFLLIYYSKSRSCLIALGVFYATYFGWPFLAKRQVMPTLFFLFLLSTIWYMTYSGAERIDRTGAIEQLLNSLSQGYGKNIDSGRSVIWNYALDSIGDHPILGWGTSLTTTNILNNGLSFHSWYLTILYHFGIVGLTTYVVILYIIWRSFCAFGGAVYSRLAASALTSMMITQTYEVSLTQNNLNLGLIYWTLFAFVLGRIARDHLQAVPQAPALLFVSQPYAQRSDPA
jgi:O-antigen ligase